MTRSKTHANGSHTKGMTRSHTKASSHRHKKVPTRISSRRRPSSVFYSCDQSWNRMEIESAYNDIVFFLTCEGTPRFHIEELAGHRQNKPKVNLEQVDRDALFLRVANFITSSSSLTVAWCFQKTIEILSPSQHVIRQYLFDQEKKVPCLNEQLLGDLIRAGDLSKEYHKNFVLKILKNKRIQYEYPEYWTSYVLHLDLHFNHDEMHVPVLTQRQYIDLVECLVENTFDSKTADPKKIQQMFLHYSLLSNQFRLRPNCDTGIFFPVFDFLEKNLYTAHCWVVREILLFTEVMKNIEHYRLKNIETLDFDGYSFGINFDTKTVTSDIYDKLEYVFQQ